MVERFRLSSHTQSKLIVTGIFALALGVYCWQLTAPGILSDYDLGVYLAASLHFVNGVMPYKDFVFVQPPGILLLLSPVAWIGRIFGAHDAFDSARLISAVVTALNASLLAWIVRHRGRTAMLVSGVGLALLPVARFVSTSLELDPYCIFFVLLAALYIFHVLENDHRIGKRSLAIGGVIFGLAALIKLWAFFPFLAMALCLSPRVGRRIYIFVVAAAGGFIAPSLPFFAFAPHNFLSEVLVEQLFRKANWNGSGGFVTRTQTLSGFGQTLDVPRGVELVGIFVVFALLLLIAYRKRVANALPDYFLLAAAIITSVGLLLAPETYPYYGYFTAPFLLGALGVATGRIVERVARAAERWKISDRIRSIVPATATLLGVILIFGLTLYSTSIYSVTTWGFGLNLPYLQPVDSKIPPGSCVLYSEIAFGLYADRMNSNNSNCPSPIDPSGMWMAWGYQLIPPAAPFVAQWKSYFEASQYVVENSPQSELIPWNKDLMKWFNSHYHLIYAKRGTVFIYKKDLTALK